MKLDVAIRETHAAEAALASGLLAVGEHHRADHDVYHLTRTLATQAQERMKALAAHADRYDVSLGDGTPGSTAAASESDDLQLLRDVRRLHLLAAEASIDWTILGQGAQAARDTELLATVGESHPDTLGTLRWTTTKLKESAPQLLTS